MIFQKAAESSFAQIAHQPVLRAYCPDIYTLPQNLAFVSSVNIQKHQRTNYSHVMDIT